MIKKISQLNELSSVVFQKNPGDKWLFEVSEKKGDVDEGLYYESYNTTVSGMEEILGINNLRSIVNKLSGGGITVVSGNFNVGLPSTTKTDTVDTYHTDNDETKTFCSYIKVEVNNALKCHGDFETHSDVYLKDENYAGKNAKLCCDSTAYFSKLIHGTAYRAQWGDLAEYYISDKQYEPGTLIKFGGEKEVTIADTVVNGVVTTEPGFILNGKDSENAIGIALVGKVPIKVRGPVRKFDKIVLSKTDPGIGVVYNYAFQSEVIARALEENLDKEEKLVICVTKFNLV